MFCFVLCLFIIFLIKYGQDRQIGKPNNLKGLNLRPLWRIYCNAHSIYDSREIYSSSNGLPYNERHQPTNICFLTITMSCWYKYITKANHECYYQLYVSEIDSCNLQYCTIRWKSLFNTNKVIFLLSIYFHNLGYFKT